MDGVKVDRALERGGDKISVTKTPAGRRFIELSPMIVGMVRIFADDTSRQPTITTLCSRRRPVTGKAQTTGASAASMPPAKRPALMEMVDDDGEQVEQAEVQPVRPAALLRVDADREQVNLKRIQKLHGTRED